MMPPLALALCPACRKWGKIDPREEWKRLVTDTFRIHFRFRFKRGVDCYHVSPRMVVDGGGAAVFMPPTVEQSWRIFLPSFTENMSQTWRKSPRRLVRSHFHFALNYDSRTTVSTCLPKQATSLGSWIGRGVVLFATDSVQCFVLHVQIHVLDSRKCPLRKHCFKLLELLQVNRNSPLHIEKN